MIRSISLALSRQKATTELAVSKFGRAWAGPRQQLGEVAKRVSIVTLA